MAIYLSTAVVVPSASFAIATSCNAISHPNSGPRGPFRSQYFFPPTIFRIKSPAGTHLRQFNLRNLLTFCKVSEGDALPAFSLTDQDGRTVSSSKFKGKPLVLFFYPADDSPGCTKQACAFRDSYEKFKKAGAEVVGISSDGTDSHKKFSSKYKLPFTLLSDGGNKLRKDWGIPGDFFGSLPGRQTYVVDKKGIVRLVFNNQFQPEKHVDETLKILQSL